MSKIGWISLSSIVIVIITFPLQVVSLRITEVDGHFLSGTPSILASVPIYIIVIAALTMLGKYFDIGWEDYGSFHFFQMFLLIFASFYFAVDCCRHEGRIQRHVDSLLISVLPIEKNPEKQIIGSWEGKTHGMKAVFIFHEDKTGQMAFEKENPIDITWLIDSTVTPYQLTMTFDVFSEETINGFIRFNSDTQLEMSEHKSFPTDDDKKDILTKRGS